MRNGNFPKTWAIEPHTVAKHRILEAYLRAWFPILSRGGFPRVIYIDGFAGPGRYAEGQLGSPILALRALAEQTIDLPSDFEFHFVEKDPAIVISLNAQLKSLRDSGGIPKSANIHVHAEMSFEEAYETELRPQLTQYANAPAFALVDPFGWTGIPMEIIGDLLKRPHTEILLNFMFEEINRFLAHEAQPDNFDALFGFTGWRRCCEIIGRERTRCIHDSYRDQLHAVAGARYVRSFEMRNERGLIDYFLFFATNSLKGLEKMKEAMWRVDPAGGFSFSDATNPAQVALFAAEPDRGLLQRLLVARFSGRRVKRGDVEKFVLESTPFLATHYKVVLKLLEANEGLSAINAPPQRRPGTFADPDLLLEFF